MSGLLKKLFSKKEVRGLMLGLDASGRTTILYKLKVLFKVAFANLPLQDL